VTFELVRGVTLCALCGPKPSLIEAEALAVRHWGGARPVLASLLTVADKGFPATPIDPSILA